jgi:Spy/CpxP family protein refolding chaperone
VATFPPIPVEAQMMVRQGIHLVGRPALGLTPEQVQQIQALLERFPRNLDELLDVTRRVDAILTPEQREKARPLRRRVRHGITDLVLEPARSRFRPEDFEKFKNEIKRRMDLRMEGP